MNVRVYDDKEDIPTHVLQHAEYVPVTVSEATLPTEAQITDQTYVPINCVLYIGANVCGH